MDKYITSLLQLYLCFFVSQLVTLNVRKKPKVPIRGSKGEEEMETGELWGKVVKKAYEIKHFENLMGKTSDSPKQSTQQKLHNDSIYG